jgi:transposase
MDDLVVKAVTEEEGELLVLIEIETRPVGCSACGMRAKSKGRRTSLIRDLEVSGRPMVLVSNKRRWCCKDPDCLAKTWTEQVAGIEPRTVLTDRARYEIAWRVGEEARSVAEVARSFGVSWSSVWDAFEAEVADRIEDPGRIEGVQAMGVDEAGFLAATKDHRRIYATGMVDVHWGILLEVIEGRSAKILADWLAARPTA